MLNFKWKGIFCIILRVFPVKVDENIICLLHKKFCSRVSWVRSKSTISYEVHLSKSWGGELPARSSRTLYWIIPNWRSNFFRCHVETILCHFIKKLYAVRILEYRAYIMWATEARKILWMSNFHIILLQEATLLEKMWRKLSEILHVQIFSCKRITEGFKNFLFSGTYSHILHTHLKKRKTDFIDGEFNSY